MPDLPTLVVTETQASRVLAAFDGQLDENDAPLTPVQAYRRWLRGRLKEYVLAQEGRALDDQHYAAKRAALNTLSSELP